MALKKREFTPESGSVDTYDDPFKRCMHPSAAQCFTVYNINSVRTSGRSMPLNRL